MKIQYLIICMFLVFGCDFQRREIKQVITHWMGRINDFSFNPKYKTFLLDSSNHVVGVGNPALNPQIWAFYQKIVQSEVLILKF